MHMVMHMTWNSYFAACESEYDLCCDFDQMCYLEFCEAIFKLSAIFHDHSKKTPAVGMYVLWLLWKPFY